MWNQKTSRNIYQLNVGWEVLLWLNMDKLALYHNLNYNTNYKTFVWLLWIRAIADSVSVSQLWSTGLSLFTPRICVLILYYWVWLDLPSSWWINNILQIIEGILVVWKVLLNLVCAVIFCCKSRKYKSWMQKRKYLEIWWLGDRRKDNWNIRPLADTFDLLKTT